MTDVFVKLSSHPPVITSEDQAVIDQFVITMYDRSTFLTEIDAVRLDMFARKQRPYDSIPPTKAALTEHTKRATYQAGCIWSQATCNMEDILDNTSASCKKLQGTNKMRMQDTMLWKMQML